MLNNEAMRETLEGINRDIDTFFGLGVKHISAYSLSLEEGTSFYVKYNKTIEDLKKHKLDMELCKRCTYRLRF